MTAPWRSCARMSRGPPARRSSDRSGASPGCSRSTSPATGVPCSPRRPTVWARRLLLRGPSAGMTPSVSTWLRWSWTTWWSAAPNRFSCSTTSPAESLFPSVSPQSSRGSRSAANRPAPPLSAVRPLSIPGSWAPTTTISRPPVSVWWRRTRSLARSGCDRGTWWWRWPPPVCIPTATPWCVMCCSARSTPTARAGSRPRVSPPWPVMRTAWGPLSVMPCSSLPGSTPVTAWRWPRPWTSTRSRTSPVVGSRPIWPG